MAMMRIRKVRMRMLQRLMPMAVAMARAWFNRRIMRMVMVRIAVVDMFMLVLVLERFVHVFVIMPFAQVSSRPQMSQRATTEIPNEAPVPR
jgi:hypothetical protein